MQIEILHFMYIFMNNNFFCLRKQSFEYLRIIKTIICGGDVLWKKSPGCSMRFQTDSHTKKFYIYGLFNFTTNNEFKSL